MATPRGQKALNPRPAATGDVVVRHDAQRRGGLSREGGARSVRTEDAAGRHDRRVDLRSPGICRDFIKDVGQAARAPDAFRHDKMRERKHQEIARTLDEARDGAAEGIEAAMDDDLGDELLGLIFRACHPCVGRGPRRAHTAGVRGLTTDETARAAVARRKRANRPSNQSPPVSTSRAAPGHTRCPENRTGCHPRQRGGTACRCRATTGRRRT